MKITEKRFFSGGQRQTAIYRIAVCFIPFGLVFFISGLQAVFAKIKATARPNFLILMADDMGWSDIGSFGSEIRTPTLDSLAKKGTTMTQFYVAPVCAPSRAMMLVGVDHHKAGVGTMKHHSTHNQRESINYGAQLHDGVVTVAEVLQQQGYETMMM